ncbi:2-oxoglutarate dehydrogenase E1 subunit family protein, partial [Mycobacterium colombiense]|uniref:2-oxoglutarate dehydrogenase E1 subunit family protein n=1 Tax=Mycobacterium colombiense TaxID=339268 RepID=UPI0020A4C446
MSNISSPFGQNEWLVEEMYRKFRDDPSSVDPSWHEFLVDYNPEPAGEPASAAPTSTDGPPAAAAPRSVCSSSPSAGGGVGALAGRGATPLPAAAGTAPRAAGLSGPASPL